MKNKINTLEYDAITSTCSTKKIEKTHFPFKKKNRKKEIKIKVKRIEMESKIPIKWTANRNRFFTLHFPSQPNSQWTVISKPNWLPKTIFLTKNDIKWNKRAQIYSNKYKQTST